MTQTITTCELFLVEGIDDCLNSSVLFLSHRPSGKHFLQLKDEIRLSGGFCCRQADCYRNLLSEGAHCSLCGRDLSEEEVNIPLDHHTESNLMKYFGLTGQEALELHRDIYLIHRMVHRDRPCSREELDRSLQLMELPLASLKQDWEDVYGSLRRQLSTLTTTYRSYHNLVRGSHQGVLGHSSGLELTWRLGTSMVYRNSQCCDSIFDIKLTATSCSACNRPSSNDDRTSLRREAVSIERMGWWLQELGVDPLQATFATHELQQDLSLINGFYCFLEDGFYQWAMGQWGHFWLEPLENPHSSGERRRKLLRSVLDRNSLTNLPPTLRELIEESATDETN